MVGVGLHKIHSQPGTPCRLNPSLQQMLQNIFRVVGHMDKKKKLGRGIQGDFVWFGSVYILFLYIFKTHQNDRLGLYYAHIALKDGIHLYNAWHGCVSLWIFIKHILLIVFEYSSSIYTFDTFTNKLLLKTNHQKVGMRQLPPPSPYWPQVHSQQSKFPA